MQLTRVYRLIYIYSMCEVMNVVCRINVNVLLLIDVLSCFIWFTRYDETVNVVGLTVG